MVWSALARFCSVRSGSIQSDLILFGAVWSGVV